MFTIELKEVGPWDGLRIPCPYDPGDIFTNMILRKTRIDEEGNPVWETELVKWRNTGRLTYDCEAMIYEKICK